MTPNFALSLSFEGIRLLHRSGDAWTSIGDVSVEAADLKDQLAKVRLLAEGLEPGPLRTKILLPDEQIRYTSIESAQTSDDDVKAALDGATPYPIDELVIDCDRSGGRTHIAAVARETLDEAEAFAVEHGFNPVAFVAVAEPLTFRFEVYFGHTKAASDLLPDGEEVTRGDAVRLAAEPVVSPAAPEPIKPAKAEKPEVEAVAPVSKPEDVVKTAPEEVAVAAEEPEVLFTRRNRDSALTATRDIPPAPPLEPTIAEVAAPASKPTPAVDPTPVAQPVIAAKAPPSAADVEDANAILGKKSRSRSKAVAAPVRGRPRYLGLVMTACLLLALLLVALWSTTLSDDGIVGWYKRTFNVVELQPPSITPDMAVAPEQVALPTPDVDIETALPSPALPIVREQTGRVLSPAEADRIYAATGVYQRAPRLPITPRETTLDTLSAARAMPAVAQMAALVFDGSGNFASDASITAPADPPPPGTRYLRDLRGFILAMPDGVLTPEGAMIYAGAPEILPRLRPGTVIQELETVVAAAPPVDPEAFRLIGGRPPLEPPARPDGLVPDVIPEVVLEVPEIVLPEAIEPEAVASAPEIILPEAIVPNVVADAPVVEAPVAPDALPEVVAEQTAVPALDEAADELIVVSGRPDLFPPLRPAAFADLVPNTNADLENAIAEALRPEEIAAPAEEPTPLIAGDPSLLGKRPTPRPNELVSEVVIAALTAGISAPQTRPEAPPAAVEEQTASAVAAAIAAAVPEANFSAVTSSAVSASVRPDSRPRNFSQVVARAQAAASRQTTTTTARAVASAPAVASGPIPGGVARAATQENAIRLRNLNLIGVYGRSNDRRALVRLSSGRYVKVEVGSSLDGGRVTAINESALNYVKNGRTQTLQLPSG